MDGTGSHYASVADVVVVGDRIAAVGPWVAERDAGPDTQMVIDARGKVVAPGFIDVHVHSEIALLGGRDQLAGVRQGVTTNLLSPDGFGWAPLPYPRGREMWAYTQFAYGLTELAPNWPTVRQYLDMFPGNTPANIYPQVPHGAVRLRALGWECRKATASERDCMVDAVDEWVDAGAGALSIGLDYQPGIHADMDELVTLAKAVGACRGIVAAHMRNQMLGRTAAMAEMVDVARRAEVPVHISHERVDGETNELFEQIGRDGTDLTFDSYLYPAGMTHLALWLPPEVQAGSLGDMLERMRDRRVRECSLPHLSERLGVAGDQIIGYTASGRFIGLRLAQAAGTEHKSLADFAYDLILSEGGLEACTMPWLASELQKEAILRQTATCPRMLVASDGIYNIPHPHPRAYGCFAQILGKYVRELGLLSLEEAVYKMSGFPARRFGLGDRGQIAEGMAADLVVFDPEIVAARSTWDRPLASASGIEWVIVNGQPVIARGVPTGRLPGRVLRRSAP